ncbi:MAG: sulfite exporter TauE/SafE family protein [Acidobacteria bacterium]|nr:MAG: sulfite exporter TauE/SafE family protein [Acidobacteriota bacterium]MCE7958328.1 sulfite exporter TauE/SafE family protein [Acidobacteria bacterium ACB2]
MTPAHVLALVASSFGAGVMNALAGGGTILTFPTLVLLGMPSIQANATSTVALLPGAAASLAGYRREVAAHREWLKTLFLPSLLGGAIGSVLLLRTPERLFSRMAPFLVLFATLLFLLQVATSRRSEAPPRPGHRGRAGLLAATLFQLGVAVYGGYFGAGIGILMLVVLGWLGLSDIHAMNGLKNFFGICINVVAAAYFVLRGAVDWPAALVMVAGASLGGFAGAHFARRIGREKARAAVVVIGFLVTGVLLLQGRS